ncbi:MAG: vWA domain-containing protein [Methyloceanibacter sp.]|uniref:vWA domain-containing protein n=1 Tax=Methyloceanibacter sp. TaxID=1965321 RepID=UPI003D6C7EF3
MRGKHFAALKLLLLPASVLGVGLAIAEDTPPLPASGANLPPAMLVLDASTSMGEKIGSTVKLDAARAGLGQAVTQYADRLSFGAVAFGHRKASNCADSEILAKPGELTAATQDKVLGAIKPTGQAPIAAAISDAASIAGETDTLLDVVLVADGGDTCDADLCVTADALKQESKGLRIHVVGLGAKPEELQPLSCIAAATGGKFVAAASESELGEGLGAIFADIANPAAASAPVAALNGASPEAPAPQAAAPPAAPVASEPPPAGEGEPGQTAIQKSPGETAVFKSGPAAQNPPPASPQEDAAAPAPQAAPQTLVQRILPPAPPQPLRPVPVSFKALITEVGPSLQSGLTWRVYNAKASANGTYELVSTHRDATPTAALLPGEYLVNAAYGLSNLTKKIKVESGKSVEETFVLNTGGLALRGVLADGSPCPEDSVRFDILTDEEDQFGKRRTILADAAQKTVIRLNAGAYHVVSLYGDANANVGVDVTVEPGRITEATIKHTGAKITFRLVQILGGEALADTKWTILTSAGDPVKTAAGALPTHILAAGSYAVVADHGGQSYTRKFSIEPGAAKQIEVAIEDGPTSPEALKALLDPPEPPPPGAGTLAGDGPGGAVGFDGFSAPADPNAPLLNPGALFRPSSP